MRTQDRAQPLKETTQDNVIHSWADDQGHRSLREIVVIVVLDGCKGSLEKVESDKFWGTVGSQEWKEGKEDQMYEGEADNEEDGKGQTKAESQMPPPGTKDSSILSVGGSEQDWNSY